MTGRLLTLLRAFPGGEPTKKKFITQMISWSCKYGEYPNGDPELNHAAGSVFVEGMKGAVWGRSFTTGVGKSHLADHILSLQTTSPMRPSAILP